MCAPILNGTFHTHDEQRRGESVAPLSLWGNHRDGDKAVPGRIAGLRVQDMSVNISIRIRKVPLVAAGGDNRLVRYL